MSYGTFAYEKADPGNLNAYLGGKIMSAAKMAAEERKFRDAEIKKLADKPERTKEEQERLQQLTGERSIRPKGKFFGKALAHEFGGDLFRRTKGTFSRDPKETEDPSLTKRQRFSALIRGEQFVKPAEQAVKPEPFKQLELFSPEKDKKSVEVQDKGLQTIIDKAFGSINNSYNIIANKLKSISNTESKNTESDDKVSSVVGKIVSGFSEIRSFFNKNNDLKKQEIKIEQQELDLKLDQKEDNEMAAKEASIESAEDLTTTADYSFGEKKSQGEAEGKQNKNLFGRIFDIVDLIDDIPFRRRKRFGGRRGRKTGSRFKGIGSIFKNPFRKSGGGSSPLKSFRKVRFGRRGASGDGGMIKPIDTQYSNQIGPLPMNSRDPWAKSPENMPGINGYSPFLDSIPKLSEGGVVMPTKMAAQKSSTTVDKKLAEGGIVDNPTVTTLGQDNPTAVIPLNRNVGKSIAKNSTSSSSNDKKMIEPLSKALQLPTQAAGGLLLSVFTSALNNLGGISSLLKPFFNVIMSPLARIFGLPANIVNTMMGGSAQAATLDSMGMAKFLSGKKSKKSGTTSGNGGAGTTPPPGAGADLSGTQVENEVDLSKNNHKDVGFTDVFDPTGTINKRGRPHKGIDIGTSGQTGYKVGMKKSGKVKFIGNDESGYGKYVDIETPEAVYRFAHLANVNSELRVGSPYNGQTIGEIGSTGRSSGAHLHFEKIVNGKQVDPRSDAAALLEIGRKTKSNFTPQSVVKPAATSPGVTPSSIGPSSQGGTPKIQGSKSSAPKTSIVNLNTQAPSQQTFAGLTTPSYLNATSSPFSPSNPQAPIYGNSNW